MRSKSKWVIICGILLLVCSFALMLFSLISADNAQKESEKIVARLKEVLPPKTVGVTDSYSSMQMPALKINGENIIGLLEITALDVALPIGSSWDKKTLNGFPQRFSGTVYDNSLIVGGYDSEGQFDCLKKLDIDSVITVTDMTGAQFKYTVERIERKSSAEADILNGESSSLTLFVRDTYSLDYIIVRCIN